MGIVGTLYAILGADTTSFTTKMAAAGATAGKLGKTLMMKLTAPLLLVAGAVTAVAASFEQKLMNAFSVTGSESEKTKNKMEDLARAMGESTVYSAGQAADAMYYMASAGWKADQMVVALEDTLNLAAATQEELAFTTNTVVSALNMFGLEASKAGMIADVYANAISNSQATLSKLGISMAYIGPIANSLGYSIEDTTTALMGLYNKGIDASMAGTGLRMSLMKLLKPTRDAHKALAGMGLVMEDLNPETNSLIEIVGKLERAHMSAKDAVLIFGARASAAMINLVSVGEKGLTTLRGKLDETGTSARMAELQISTFKGQWKLLTSALSEVAIQFGKILLPLLKDLINNHIKPFVQWISNLSEGWKKAIVSVAGFLASLGPLLLLFKGLTQVLPFLVLGFKKLAISVWAATGPIGLVAAGITLIASQVPKWIKNFKNATKSISDWEHELSKATLTLKAFMEWIAKDTVSQKEFGDAVMRNHGDIAKVMEKLADGTLKHAKNLQVAYNYAKKNAEEAKKAAAEALAAQEKATERSKAERAGQIALSETYLALNKTVDEYVDHLEDVESIKGTLTEERQKELDAMRSEIDTLDLAYIAHDAVNESLKDRTNMTPELVKKLKSQRDAIEEIIASEVKKLKGAPKIIKSLVDERTEMDKLEQQMLTLHSQYLNGEKTLKEYSAETGVIRDRIHELKSPFEDLGMAVEDYGDHIDDAGDSTDVMSGLLDDLNESVGKGEKHWEELAEAAKKAQEKMAQTLGHLGNAFETLGERIGGGLGAIVSAVGDLAENLGNSWSDITKDGEVNWGKLADVAMDSLDDIGGAIGELISGKENSFASLGSSIGGIIGNIFGPLGGAIGTFAGGILGGLFGEGESDAEREARLAAEHLQNLADDIQGVVGAYADISDELAATIAESALEMEGFAAISKHFGEIIAEVGVNQENINDLWIRATDIIHQTEQGFLTAEEGAEALGSSFEQLLAGAQEFGTEGSAAMVDFINKVKESGIEIAAVTDYINDQLGVVSGNSMSAAEGLEAMAGGVGDSEEAMMRLENATMAVYNAMIANGATANQAMASLGGTLDAIAAKHKEMGTKATGAIKELLKLRGIIDLNKELMGAIEGNLAVLTALANTGSLTQETLNDAATSAKDYYNQLLDAGMTANQALMQMGPSLEHIIWLAQQHGMEVDAATLALYEEAVAAGYVADKQMDLNDIMLQGLAAIIEALGGDLPDAFADAMGSMTDDAEDAAASMEDSFSDAADGAIGDVDRMAKHLRDTDFKAKVDWDSNFPSTPGNRRTLPGYQHGGIAWTPQIATLAEHVPEIIIPLDKFNRMRMGGVPGEDKKANSVIVNNYISALDSQDVYRFMSGKGKDALLQVLKANIGGFTRELKFEAGKY